MRQRWISVTILVMDLRSADTRIGTFRLWVLLFLLLFIALCGVHLFVLHHAGDAHLIELATAIELVILAMLAFSLNRNGGGIAATSEPNLFDIVPMLKKPPGRNIEFFAPIRV